MLTASKVTLGPRGRRGAGMLGDNGSSVTKALQALSVLLLAVGVSWFSYQEGKEAGTERCRESGRDLHRRYHVTPR